MDGTLYFPSLRIDVHMGPHNLQCVDCHRERPHHHDRLDAHTQTLACQTYHIPRMAIDAPTKMSWDWSLDWQQSGVAERKCFLYLLAYPPRRLWN